MKRWKTYDTFARNRGSGSKFVIFIATTHFPARIRYSFVFLLFYIYGYSALHDGRCTTSQAVAALGLLEPKAGKSLGVPPSWIRGSQGAYERLRKSPIRTLDEMNGKFFDEAGPTKQRQEEYAQVWDADNITDEYSFVAKYTVRDTEANMRWRRQVAHRLSIAAGRSMIISVRLNWGNAQEPTAILTALNYFVKKEPRIKIEEVGLCGAGLSINTTGDELSSKLLVGATPDALISWPDGTVEALEVKNHCPFMPDRRSKRKYYVRDMPFENPSIPPVYLPQLMMEMMCVGPECRSAVMVRQTALSGAVIMRVKRNDDWIKEMLYWLEKFNVEYVQANIPPPKNVFWEDSDCAERYKRFVNTTRMLASSAVEILDHVQNDDIQRVESVDGGQIELFLDN